MQSLHRCRGLELQRFHEERIQFSTCVGVRWKGKRGQKGNPTCSVRKQGRFGGKLTSSARNKLISSLHLLLAEIQKRGKFGVFFRGLKHNYVTRVEFETSRVSSFVKSFYSTGKSMKMV